MPVPCPELSYQVIEIQEGDSASLGWLRMIESRDKTFKEDIARGLPGYCGLDTLAMLELLKVLRE